MATANGRLRNLVEMIINIWLRRRFVCCIQLKISIKNILKVFIYVCLWIYVRHGFFLCIPKVNIDDKLKIEQK